MLKKSENTVKELIEGLRASILNDDNKVILKSDPLLQERGLERDRVIVDRLVEELRGYRHQLFKYVHKLKDYVPLIMDQTCECAVYLLVSQVFKLWDAIFLLAKSGNNTAAMVVIRAIKEHNMLIKLLSMEHYGGSSVSLKKWFEGEIIKHEAGRQKMKSFMIDNKIDEIDSNEMHDLSTHIYSMESVMAHPTYESVLENINPFIKDFDKGQFTGIYRSIAVLKYANGTMTNTGIAMKFVFGFVLKERETSLEIGKIINIHISNV